MDSVAAENTVLTYDDPRPIFEALFPNGMPQTKDKFETELEFQTKLKGLGIEGKEFTFLIAPEHCEILPYPDQNFYVVRANEGYFTFRSSNEKPYGITIEKVDKKTEEYVGQNAYGATANVREIRKTYLQVAPVDFFTLPKSLRWAETAHSVSGYFGLPIRIVDPAFRDKLKKKKIGLAVRIKVADIKKLNYNTMYSPATISDPVLIDIIKPLLPVFLLDAWIVDTETNISLVHWSKKEQK
jgi:hypothetical protein